MRNRNDEHYAGDDDDLGRRQQSDTLYGGPRGQAGGRGAWSPDDDRDPQGSRAGAPEGWQQQDRAGAQATHGGRQYGQGHEQHDRQQGASPAQHGGQYGGGQGQYDTASGARGSQSPASDWERSYGRPGGLQANAGGPGGHQPRMGGSGQMGPGRPGSGQADWSQAAGGGPQAGFRGRGPKGYARSDARITEDLNEKLADDDFVDASEISVSVNQGVATLTGTVNHRWMKHRAEDITEACSGIKDVRNEIRVQRDEPSAHGGTAGTAGLSSGADATGVMASSPPSSPTPSSPTGTPGGSQPSSSGGASPASTGRDPGNKTSGGSEH